MTATSQIHILGVRHHGPGSARAVTRALAELRPDLILVEGPPEADDLVPLAASRDLVPPVALLVYTDEPQLRSAAADTTGGPQIRSAFWPFAVFSPEWQAIRYAVDNHIPLRFCDLPAAYRFGMAELELDGLRVDPIAELAAVAGYDDAERWWEDIIEHRRDGVPPFAAIAEAMAAVRATVQRTQTTPAADTVQPEPETGRPVVTDEVREAYMRSVLRAACKEGYRVIAVVCGAWHVPALTDPMPPAAQDAALLGRLPKKIPVTATWVPWTHGRLASWRGYGAGVASPGWYHHLFTTPDRVVERWLVQVAELLRDEDLPVSTAHVIEAVRLAEALATLRGRPLPGLAEMTEATRAVLCEGDETRLKLVFERLVVGEQLGRVPEETPSVPLMRDLAAAQRRLRLKPEAQVRELNLDLREQTDLARSRLLHRLRLLGVTWGTPIQSRRGRGTFRETWRLEWRPKYTVDLIAASAYGTTVASAATRKAREAADQASDLAEITSLVESCLMADLPEALGPVLTALRDRMAVDVDVVRLMDSLPALARTLRYGDVRGTDTTALTDVVTGMAVRITVGLPPALTNLDDTAAAAMCQWVEAVQAALNLVADIVPVRDRWLDMLAGLADRSDLHGLVVGRINRLLHDDGWLDSPTVERRMARILTVGVPPAHAVAWIEGFLSGSGLLLVHDEKLLSLVDGWLTAVPPDTFIKVLPLLRRAFATFTAPERRLIGERIRRGSGPRLDSDAEEKLDSERVAWVLPTLTAILDEATSPTPTPDGVTSSAEVA